MNIRALLATGVVGLAILVPAYARDNRPRSNNPNVKRAMKKAKKVRPKKYRAPKKSKKPPAAKYGAKRV